MPRDTLLDFFADLAAWPGDFLVHDDGYRSWHHSYVRVAGAARAFAVRLAAAGLAKGDTVILWGENRPEWIVAFWGCLLRGVVVVPVDYRASCEFLAKVRGIVEARIVLAGDEVEVPELPDGVACWPLRELLEDRVASVDAGAFEPAAMTRDDLVEIIFTSGATAEPKGVLITHRNVLANIVPIENEVRKYRTYGRPFFPLRFLNLLPLSHMFGQSMATFVPPMLPAVVVFMRGYNPHDILRQIRTRRVSVLVSVPKILDVLREHVERAFPETVAPLDPRPHWSRRWWRYRRVHRAFGAKFWAFVVGAAPLDPGLEEFMSKLGFLVIQGYGLTETAPIVTLNHPFSTRKGSVGKPIHGVEVRIAEDGEILVRGDNVTRGYYRAEAAGQEAFAGGWLHTGDIGGVDEDGRLFIKGRKKEMIVTPEGLNVFPEDVERALAAVRGVRDAAVVGTLHAGEERVHAVLVLDPGTDPHHVVREANAQLGDHQKIRGASVWPGGALPRTEGTRKLRRREIKAWVDGGGVPQAAPAAPPGASLEEVVGRFVHGERVLSPATTIDELGLSSLERVELLMALEERFQVSIDEAAYAAAGTIGDLAVLVRPLELPRAATAWAPATDGDGIGQRGGAPAAAVPGEPVEFPTWNRRGLARLVRRVSLPTWILPLARLFVWLRVEGREHLRGLDGPVVFAANHQSHLDTPAILAALPRPWRYRVAVAMAKEFFTAHFFPERHGRRAWFTNSLNYYLASLFFNAFPLPQREAGTRQTLRYIGELFSEGHSLLIFPEGKRTMAGEINTFQAGVGMIGARLGVPVVPVRLEGLDRVLHQQAKMATPGRVRVAFGAPMQMRGEDYRALARQVEARVREL
jgi:long-chain acyl-CoA synthetase